MYLEDYIKNMSITFIPLATACDILKMNYLNNIDINICNYIAEQTPNIYFCPLNKGKKISTPHLFQRSIEQIAILGEETQLKIIELTDKVPIHSNGKCHCFQTGIIYTTSENTKNIITNSGTISQYIIPKKTYESDIASLGHEHCHALKDTNYKEYINLYTIGETIPIFYELIVNEDNESIKQKVLQTRMHYLYRNSAEFLLLSEIINNNSYSERSVYNYMQSKAGCYLNSFYYALILYNKYKENPAQILNLVNKVLKHEITTIEMLICLNIYGGIHGEIFEKELHNIKKALRKEK